jgi:hypothetical protein
VTGLAVGSGTGAVVAGGNLSTVVVAALAAEGLVTAAVDVTGLVAFGQLSGTGTLIALGTPNLPTVLVRGESTVDVTGDGSSVYLTGRTAVSSADPVVVASSTVDSETSGRGSADRQGGHGTVTSGTRGEVSLS